MSTSTNTCWDVIIIGAGPAGLAAASVLVPQQLSVLLVDEQHQPGGQIYRALARNAEGRAGLLGLLGADYGRGCDLLQAAVAAGVTHLPGSTVWQVTPSREVWLSRGGRSERHQAKSILLATGAMERPVPVPGWTLPGVMTAGAVQILLKDAGLRSRGPILFAGSGPLLYLVAVQSIAAGVPLAGILETPSGTQSWRALPYLPAAVLRGGLGDLLKGLSLKRFLARSGVPWFKAVRHLEIQSMETGMRARFESRGRDQSIDAALVALHEGVIPAQQITRSIGLAHRWDGAGRYFHPVVDCWGNSSVADILVAGDGAGIVGARAAEAQGRLAAFEIAHRLGRIDLATRDRLAAADRRRETRARAIRPLLDRLFAPPPTLLAPPDPVVICRCEAVTAGALRAAVRQGCPGPNQAKAFLRVGMGPCQGRMCGPTVSSIIAEASGQPIDSTGYFRIRPPLKPISVGELAAMEPGD